MGPWGGFLIGQFTKALLPHPIVWHLGTGPQLTAEELGKCGVFMCPGGGREENRFSEHLGFPCRASVVALSMDGGAW